MVNATVHVLSGPRRVAMAALTILAPVFACALLAPVATAAAHDEPLAPDAAMIMAAPHDVSDWSAWVSAMPGRPRSLHVQGAVTVPTPGYLVRLTKAAPQGFNPRNLILDLTIAPLPGIWLQVEARKQVSFRIDKYAGEYDSILVRFPDGSGVPLGITVAQ